MDSHRQNFIENLESTLAEKLNDFEESQAFVRAAALWLNYENLPDDNFVDGAEDLGMDFWQKSEAGFETFQVKSHEMISNNLNLAKFNNEGVKDLTRFLNFLFSGDPKLHGNKKVENFRHQWDDTITRILMSRTEQKKPLRVTIGLILFGDSLTDPAQKEYNFLVSRYQEPVEYRKVLVEVKFKLISIEDLFNEKWRQYNRAWRDKNNQKRNYIYLTPEGLGTDEHIISSKDSAIFYVRAIDLVTAFEDFGYQIFEPNVRANISKSRINAEIRNTLSRRKSRKEFKFLNNGVTLTCTNFRKPKENNPYFVVYEPGIVNGLQTISALHEAYYHELDSDAKAEFENDCYVLVRLITDKAVSNINDVVIATNSQNPMQPRNLKSNSNEQILYEKLFADLNFSWFYERKQGAWDAFSADPERWRTLSNYKKSHFQVEKRSKYRVVDNHELGQTWLAFIGFSNEAVNDRRYIFERERMYDVTFLHKLCKHGADFGFDMESTQDYLISGSPSPSLMLASYLSNRFATSTSLSFKETREEAYNRLKLDPQKMGIKQLDAELAKDDRYLLESVISGMSFVFTEMFGYVLYKALGDRIHTEGNNILRNGSLKLLNQNYDAYLPELVKSTRQEDIKQDDLLPIAWFIFRECLEQMLSGQWKLGFQTARSRSRFNHSKETRTLLFNTLESINRYMEKAQVLKVWAAAIPPKKGLFQYFRDVILSSR